MAGFGLPVMGLHTANFLCFEAGHTWLDLCARALLGPQMPFFLILALYMCFKWKYVELNSWCGGHWGYTTCSPERCGAIHNTAFWKLNETDNCCQSCGYTRVTVHVILTVDTSELSSRLSVDIYIGLARSVGV
eukprot:942026-Pelagomonas_calceolata.AAC.1